MKKLSIGIATCVVGAVCVIVVLAQPPGGRPGGPPGGPGRFGPGGPGGRGGPGGPMGPGGPRGMRPNVPPIVDTKAPQRPESEDRKADRGLVFNADLELATPDKKAPLDFTLAGDALYGYLGTPGKDVSGWGARLMSAQDVDKDGAHAGSLTCTVSGLRSSEGRWFRFSIRSLAQEGFKVADDQLFLKVDFFSASGSNAMDGITKKFYGEIEQDRRDLGAGKTKFDDGASWRTHTLEFRLPFPEIDTLRLSVGFTGGKGQGQNAEFWVDSLDLERIGDPAEFVAMRSAGGAKPQAEAPPALSSLVPLGGRWYYDPRGASMQKPEKFDHANADRLYWYAGRLETPFADNMSAWLRRGWLDAAGKIVEQDRFVPESLEVQFTSTHMVVHTHNLPNHPTASFPDVSRSIDGNPNFIQEQDATWYIPLSSVENPQHIAMNAGNDNHALPLGPLGVAVNGVMFNDPYDAGREEAMWRLDRCCGHPSPTLQYHYHKYPVCVKTPWFDDGAEHSGVIGWAFDGFAIYGPYESQGVMAKDSKDNPLNAFNGHYDEVRGWHYHVTPGRWPYVIGGFWGTADERNIHRRGPGGGGPPG
ncbi:MAG TPA: YHYH protein, partial [Pirellulales bacterium]|nr:YHYH protein [Pirellulales bacterium]